MACTVCGGVPAGGIEPSHICSNGHSFAVHDCDGHSQNPISWCPFCGAEAYKAENMK